MSAFLSAPERRIFDPSHSVRRMRHNIDLLDRENAVEVNRTSAVECPH